MNREKHIRHALFIFSLVAIFIAVSGLDFGRTSRYDDLLVDSTTYKDIKDDRTELLEPDNPELYFDDNQIHFDSLSDHFLYSLVKDSPSKENPIVRTVSQEFTTYDIAILNDVLSSESIETNDKAHLLLYNDDSYKEFTLSATTLPIVSLRMTVTKDDRDNPIGSFDKQAHFELFDNREDIAPSERVVKSQAYARLRGASSLNFPKNQFRLNLREFSIGGDESNAHHSLLDMREDDDWILNSAYNDPEKMRNLLSTNLWHDTMGENNPFDVNTGTEGRVVEVFIDDMYWGIYTLMHPIDAKSLELNLNDTDSSDFYYRSFSNIYFIEDDLINNSPIPTRGRFELREPEPSGEQYQWDPLIEHMLALEYEESELTAYLNEHTHLSNQIDYYLFTILLQATDNDRKNHNYIAKHIDNQHVIIESPWDLDLTWGLHWQADHPRLSIVRGDPLMNYSPKDSLINRAINIGDTEIMRTVLTRYKDLRQTHWSEENLMSYIDEYEQSLYDSGSVHRDVDRWPTSAFNPDTSELRSYIFQRLTSMDSYLEERLGGAEAIE